MNLRSFGWEVTLTVAWLLGVSWEGASARESETGVTNVAQFQRRVARDQRVTCSVRLEGVVCWVNPQRDRIVFQDASGVVPIEVDPQAEPISAGQKVRVTGECTGIGGGDRFVIGRRMLVNNDGSHATEEKSADVFLQAGKHPVCVSWFNRDGVNQLELFYQGPALSRQTIPDSAWWRRAIDPVTGAVRWSPGLAWSSYEGDWWVMPEFNQLRPVAEGTATNCSLAVKSRDHFVALQFSGYLDVPQDGRYTISTVSAGGSRVLLGLPLVQVVGVEAPPVPRRLALGQMLAPDEESVWAEVEGVVDFARRTEPRGLSLSLSSGTGRMRVEVANSEGLDPARLLHGRVRVTGICREALTLDGQRIPGVCWVTGAEQVRGLTDAPAPTGIDPDAEPGSQPLRLLTTVAEIKRLKREDAMRGYPVRIRGVVTWSTRTAVVLQDATSGIFVDEVEVNDSYHLRLGEAWEVEGLTVARFSPMVLARRVTRLGRGTYPEPIQPAWDQLMNGTLDAQYVEIQGIVSAVESNRVTLLTRQGKIQAHLPETPAEEVKSLEGALIRIRGCLWAAKDEVTHKFKIGQVQIHSAAINVDERPPADPFAAPPKRAAELLLFDAQAGPFNPVKVVAQVVHGRGREYYLMDGTNGLRFIPHDSLSLQAGDLVEMVGFPELGGPSPALREGRVRWTGRAALPPARHLTEETWLSGDLDSTLVQTEAQLMNLSTEQEDQVLGLQTGAHLFLARLRAKPSLASWLPIGSQLRLTGIYAGRGGDRAAGRVIDSFELLLNSPADIQILARPSWWTLRRMMTMVTVLGGVLVAAMIWISLLRRQVEQRTAQLRAEIQERERGKKLRAIEEERARIARDLHDDLGSSLTEITLLADAGPGRPASLERAASRFRMIGDKARAVVKALDVIVWLVNPSKDALPFLAGYLGSYAEEYLSASGLACRLKIPVDIPPLRLNADVRHNLFLAVKEVLHNAVRHAHASEVLMEFQVRQDQLEIAISDNGRGFDPTARAEGNGLANLQERLASAGGRCEVNAQPGAGTQARLILPLPASTPAP